jgi:hypothetical protein
MIVGQTTTRKGKASCEAPADAEALAFLAPPPRPSSFHATKHMISKELRALELCLVQQQKLLAILTETPTKEVVIRNVVVARALCEKIQEDFARQSDNVTPDIGTSNVAA